MARPTNPNKTRIIKATRTIAWPRSVDLKRAAISIFRPVYRGGTDDDVAGELRDERRDRYEVVANRHLQGGVVVGRIGSATRTVVESPLLSAGRILQCGRQRFER